MSVCLVQKKGRVKHLFQWIERKEERKQCMVHGERRKGKVGKDNRLSWKMRSLERGDKELPFEVIGPTSTLDAQREVNRKFASIIYDFVIFLLVTILTWRKNGDRNSLKREEERERERGYEVKKREETFLFYLLHHLGTIISIFRSYPIHFLSLCIPKTSFPPITNSKASKSETSERKRWKKGKRKKERKG